MAMKGVPLDDATYDYVVERFASPERDLLRRMAERAQAAGLPPIMISEDQAKLLRILLQAVQARRVLDVGTLFGYSAAVMASALPASGRVVSLESEPKHADVARQNLRDLGLGDKVEVRIGQALDVMRKLPADSFDVVLIDADKASYVDYLAESVRLVRRGGLIAADNTLAWGQIAKKTQDDARGRDVAAIQRFNDVLAKHVGLDSTILPVGDGLALAYVREKHSVKA